MPHFEAFFLHSYFIIARIHRAARHTRVRSERVVCVPHRRCRLPAHLDRLRQLPPRVVCVRFRERRAAVCHRFARTVARRVVRVCRDVAPNASRLRVKKSKEKAGK